MDEVDAAVKRGRGRPSGPSLKVLLTQSYPDGAMAEELVAAGFLGDLQAAIKRGDVRQLDGEGRYVWIGDAAPDCTRATAHPTGTSEEAPRANLVPVEVFRRALAHFGKIDIAQIRPGDRCREVSQKWVEKLADSMRELGLQNPVTVIREGNGFVLVAGRHRLEAAKLLGWKEIPCAVVSMDDLTRRLWEIDENFCRAELTELERGEHLARRKEIYERLHPEARQHVSGAVAANAAMGRGNATDNLSIASFAADTADKTGLDERTIRRSIHRAEHIAPEVRDMIRDMPEIANKAVELDALANMLPEHQATVVAAVKSGDVPNVRAAAGSRARIEEAKAAIQKQPTPNPPTAQPTPIPTTAQKWAYYLADQMSIPELRDVRDALNKILAAAEHRGPRHRGFG